MSKRLGVGLWIGLGLMVSLLLWMPVHSAAGQQAAGSSAAPTPTTVPFLQPPFARKYRVTSYFDHQSPDHSWDDTIIIFNGEQASAIDGILDRTPTFLGGYYLPKTNWYAYYDGHPAFDYGTGAGTTILAAAPGEVVFAGSVPTSCASPLQYVALRHANGYLTYYLHLEGIAVRKGQWVETGDPLGISGNSGCSLGAHLHFAVEYNGWLTDPYGWQPADRPDPLIAHSGAAATWLWAPELPLAPVGKLTQPPRDTKTNGDLFMQFVPEQDSPPVARVAFLAFYGNEWHSLGEDTNGADGWSLTWDTRSAPEGTTWLHAWAIGTDGRVGKGSPIRDDITIDRHAPQGFIVGLSPEGADGAQPAAGSHLWLYAASYDPASTTQRVTFLIREGGGEWREIGDATWLHTSNWLLEWDAAGLADGARFDVVARLTDGAGNATLTQPVEGIVLDRRVPGGEVVSPQDGTPFTTTLNLVFSPFPAEGTAPISHVAFYAWYDGTWHAVGVDRDGSDGWAVAWNPASVQDQTRMRIQAQVYDAEGRVNTALPQVTALALDRTPPTAGYTRPQTGGVARPDVAQWIWASDGGSGVAWVEFFVNMGQGWLKIGEDRIARDGWSLLWGAQDVPDGVYDFGARVYDQAGNVGWATDVRRVAFDRTPPGGQFTYPAPGTRLEGTVTLSLDMADNVSGLDRAVFYAWYDDGWHHLGVDADHEDGFSVEWDTAAVGERSGVTLTAWVYDRAGNQVELPHVEGITLAPPGSAPQPPAPTVTPVDQTPTPSQPERASNPPEPTETVEATPTPTASPTPSATPTATPSLKPSPSPTATPSPTPSATPTWTPTLAATATPRQVAAVPTATGPAPATPTSPAEAAILDNVPPPIPAAFWYLVGGGGVVALALLVTSLRSLRARR